MNIRRSTATLAVAGLLAAPLGLAAPAMATEKEFRVGGANVDFEVEKDDGRFEVEVDIEDAKPGTRWRIALWHDGKRYFNQVRRANGDGDVRDVERVRKNTKGKDVFTVRVKRIGGEAKVRKIRKR